MSEGVATTLEEPLLFLSVAILTYFLVRFVNVVLVFPGVPSCDHRKYNCRWRKVCDRHSPGGEQPQANYRLVHVTKDPPTYC